MTVPIIALPLAFVSPEKVSTKLGGNDGLTIVNACVVKVTVAGYVRGVTVPVTVGLAGVVTRPLKLTDPVRALPLCEVVTLKDAPPMPGTRPPVQVPAMPGT